MPLEVIMNREEELIKEYALVAHPEGGWFSECYTSENMCDGRALAGSIFFLLRRGERSVFHQIDCDEIWYYHEGCGMRITVLTEAARGEYLLGSNLKKGERAMVVVPKGAVFSAENVSEDGYTFVSCMTAPKFSYDGFRFVYEEELRRKYPDLPEEWYHQANKEWNCPASKEWYHSAFKEKKRIRVMVRGAGDLGSGTIHRLFRAGFPVLAVEQEHPSAIRRMAAFSEAVYKGKTEVEGVTAVLAEDPEQAERILREGRLPVMIDPAGDMIRVWKPDVLVDATLSKKNTGISMDLASLTIGLGPGFEAGKDVTCVVETMRGHDLGRILTRGTALPDTGVPGIIGGYGKERVIHAPAAGLFRQVCRIGDVVRENDRIGFIETECGEVDVRTKISGVLRGILPDRFPVSAGFKTADVDPRVDEKKNCHTISDKSRCIAGSVLEIVCAFERNGGEKHK